MSQVTRNERPLGRVLFVGYGKLARRVAPRLVPYADGVTALRRSEADAPAGVELISADVSRTLARLPAVDSLLVTLPPGDSTASYRTALTHVARALPDAPTRTIFVSSTGVYEGADPHRPLTEDDQPVAVTDRSHGLIDGERAAVELFGATVLRPAGIYGPGREFMLRRVRAQTPTDHGRWTNRIHEDDLVAALTAMLRAGDVPTLLHAVDQRPAPLGEVLAHVAELLDLPTPPDEGDGTPSGHILDGTRFHDWFGELRHPSYATGYADMIRRAE